MAVLRPAAGMWNMAGGLGATRRRPGLPPTRTRATMATRTSRGARLIPLYHQVYLHLRDMIAAWPVPDDRPLPSEPSLAKRFGVSRVTIRATLAQLEVEGLIRRVHGVGTFPITEAMPDRTNITGHLENLISFEDATTVENLEWSNEALPDAAAARALGPTLGLEPCLRLVRVRSFADKPVSFTTIIVPRAHAGLVTLPPAGNIPVIRLLEQRGVIARSAEQVLSAVAAPALAARHLLVPEGSPLIAMRRLMLDEQRQPILHQESLYVPDRFEYRMTLSRTSVGQVAKWTPTG
jgi:GntR family transcriptional regulator